MQNLRQLGGGVIIALVSVILVIGGISLALSETLPSQATPSPIPPTISLQFPTATFTAGLIFTETPTETPSAITSITETLFATNTLFVQVSCVQPAGWIRITTAAGDTIYSLAQRYKTTAEALGAANCLSSFDIPVGFGLYVPPVPTVTVIPCGPPSGYVKRHIVQPGETLYRIATLYGITYPQLQRANCMGSSTTIYAGQLLWVPNVATITSVPGTTVVPSFPTATATATATSTSIPTDTAVPTATSTPTVPATFTPSNTPPSPSQ
jgi:LysM repeat protein